MGEGRQPELRIKKLTLSEMISLISQLGNSTVFSHDHIDAQAIKQAADILAPPLLHVINLSIEEFFLKIRWKISRIVPLYKGKKQDKLTPSSYRPVSLVPTISKLAKKGVQKQVLKCMEDEKLLNHHIDPIIVQQ